MMGKLNVVLAREAAESGIDRAVETGTCFGNGAAALAEMFEHVETIELSLRLALRAKLRFATHRRVRVRWGDSAKALRPSSQPTLYWLDGHWSGGMTAGERRQCPLLDEIRATSPGTFGDWYLIDDARLFSGRLDPELDPNQWPTVGQIRELVIELRPEYSVEVRTDLDLIVVTPKSRRA